MKRNGGRAGGALALGLLLAACGGRVVPPSAGPAPVRPPVRSPTTYPLPSPRAPAPVARPVPAVPLAPMPAAPVPGATTAAAAGLVAGPPIASLPIDDADAESARQAFALSCPGLIRRADPTA